MSESDSGEASQAALDVASGDGHSEGNEPPPLFVRHEVNGIAYGQINQGDGLAIIGAFPIGMTLDGVDQTNSQRTFLEAFSVGHPFVAYDERGAGGSGGAGTPEDWEQLGRDMWAVADAAGVERAIVYGVFDAAYTAVQAAAIQPDRVLGLILNFMPPAFGKPEGVAPELLDAWSLSTDAEEARRFAPARVLQDLGLDASDSRALGQTWIASTPAQTVQARAALLQRFDYAPLLREVRAPGLIIEPQRRALFQGWGDVIAQSYPDAKVVRPMRGSEALGAIYAYLVLRSLAAGPLASRLSATQSQAVEASERAVRDLNRIVVPVDGTIASGRAVNLASRLGDNQNAELVLLHVITVPRSRALEDPPPEAVEGAEQALEMAAAIAARHHVRPRTRVIYQRSLVEGIIRVATEEVADLIVIANPGIETEGSPMGNIMEELLKRAPCEVLVDRGDPVEAVEAP